jgi:hypothetical protein
MIPYVKSNYNSTTAITAYINGVPKTINEDHINFIHVDKLLLNQNIEPILPQILSELMDAVKAMKEAVIEYDAIQIIDNEVIFDGTPVHGLLSDMMISIVQGGSDVTSWCRFMIKLNENPAAHAVNELYEWMMKAQMPITENGNFLAYKKVKDDYTSAHPNADGSHFPNKLGTRVEMPRNKVDDNRQNTCSTGLHFCSWSYLPSYMGNSGRVLLVEINPADVVSIPTDYDFAKGRASGYWIVGEISIEDAEHAFDNISTIDYHNDNLVNTYGSMWEKHVYKPTRDALGRFAYRPV